MYDIEYDTDLEDGFKSLYENTIFTLDTIAQLLTCSRSTVKNLVKENYSLAYQKNRTNKVRNKGFPDWVELYETTYLPTGKIEKALGLPKDSVRQKARTKYSDNYRRDRELKVRKWPADDGSWRDLFENTELTYDDISEATGLSMKQLHTRIHSEYSKERISARKSITYKRARAERVTTISEEGTDQRSGSGEDPTGIVI